MWVRRSGGGHGGKKNISWELYSTLLKVALLQSLILEYTTVFNSGVKKLFCTSDLFVLPVQALALCLSYILLFSHSHSEVHDAHLSSILAYSVSISSSLGFHLALDLHAPSLCAHG